MGLFFPLLGAFALAVILVYLFARPKGPDAGRRLLKRAGAGTLLAIGGVLALTGKVAVGVPLIAVGLYLWRPAILEPGAAIENGTVRLGPFAGRTLASLGRDELVQLYFALASRPRDRAVLEAHLDRRIPGWREDFQRDTAGRTRRPSSPGAMTDEQAYQILGLAPGAAEAEIQAAYRRLMKRVHPDQGGSTFLAAQINEAKDRLLGRHR